MKISVCLPIKRFDSFGSSRFFSRHLLLFLRKRWLQSPQPTELRFHHAVMLYAVRTVAFKVHVALQLRDGFVIQFQPFLQALTRPVQCIRSFGLKRQPQYLVMGDFDLFFPSFALSSPGCRP